MIMSYPQSCNIGLKLQGYVNKVVGICKSNIISLTIVFLCKYCITATNQCEMCKIANSGIAVGNFRNKYSKTTQHQRKLYSKVKRRALWLSLRESFSFLPINVVQNLHNLADMIRHDTANRNVISSL